MLSARELFLRNGYATTTVAAVAAAAGTSVETVYKGFGGKPGLVRAICGQALQGEGSLSAEVRSDSLQASEDDPRAIIRGWRSLSIEVAPLISPILLLVRAAATADAEMAELRTELDDGRLDRMRHNARSLSDPGHLRPGINIEHAAEVLWTYTSPELYELLVLIRGWSIERYGDFVADSVAAALLP